MQVLLLRSPVIQQHPEWVIGGMTQLFLNVQPLLATNPLLYGQASPSSAHGPSALKCRLYMAACHPMQDIGAFATFLGCSLLLHLAVRCLKICLHALQSQCNDLVPP